MDKIGPLIEELRKLYISERHKLLSLQKQTAEGKKVVTKLTKRIEQLDKINKMKWRELKFFVYEIQTIIESIKEVQVEVNGISEPYQNLSGAKKQLFKDLEEMKGKHRKFEISVMQVLCEKEIAIAELNKVLQDSIKRKSDQKTTELKTLEEDNQKLTDALEEADKDFNYFDTENLNLEIKNQEIVNDTLFKNEEIETFISEHNNIEKEIRTIEIFSNSRLATLTKIQNEIKESEDLLINNLKEVTEEEMYNEENMAKEDLLKKENECLKCNIEKAKIDLNTIEERLDILSEMTEKELLLNKIREENEHNRNLEELANHIKDVEEKIENSKKQNQITEQSLRDNEILLHQWEMKQEKLKADIAVKLEQIIEYKKKMEETNDLIKKQKEDLKSAQINKQNVEKDNNEIHQKISHIQRDIQEIFEENGRNEKHLLDLENIFKEKDAINSKIMKEQQEANEKFDEVEKRILFLESQIQKLELYKSQTQSILNKYKHPEVSRKVRRETIKRMFEDDSSVSTVDSHSLKKGRIQGNTKRKC